MGDYVLPNFKLYKPQYLDDSIKQIKKSKLYKANYDKQPKREMVEEALNKIRNNEVLSKRDIKALSFHLLTLEMEGLFDRYYKTFVIHFNEIRSKTYYIRPLLGYLYNSRAKHKERIYEVMKAIIKVSTKRKQNYTEVFNLVESTAYVNEFINKIKIKFTKIASQNDISRLCQELYMKVADELYNECIAEFIIANYLDDRLWNFYKDTITNMTQELKKRIFKSVMLNYMDEYDVASYPKQWFQLIYRQLGDPYDPINHRWKGLEEEKEVFRRWNIDENIEKFFEQIVGGDKRRKSFWKRYINNIYRIEYFEEASKALALEFKNHMFVEFAESGNACYYYHKNDFDINKVREVLKGSSLNRSAKVKFLKQGTDKKNHSGDWEYQFDYSLRSLGYTRSR